MTYSPRQLALLKQIGVDVWVEKTPRAQTEDASQKIAANSAVQSGSVEQAEIVQPQVKPADSESLITDAAPAITPEVKSEVQIQKPFTTLDELRHQVSQCNACVLANNRTQTVFGVGNENADWLFIGEAPGQKEDIQGEPFVGQAGNLLDAMLKALSLSRQQVYIANTVKCHPPDNRSPLPEEIQQCKHFLNAQIELIAPKVIVALGLVSAQALTGKQANLAQLRGQVYAYGENQIPLVVTYHPAYLLRRGLDKALAWQDLCMARAVIDS